MRYLPAREDKVSFSIPSILAVVAALGSFWVGGAILGLILAIAAIVLGLIGALMALSPRVRGGLVSAASIGLGVIGIVTALVRFFTLNWF